MDEKNLRQLLKIPYDRLDAINRLKRKYGATIDEILSYRQGVQEYGIPRSPRMGCIFYFWKFGKVLQN